MSKFRFDLKSRAFTSRRKDLSLSIAQEGVKESMKAFQYESWNGKAWKPSKIQLHRKLLQKTGKLKRSIRPLITSSVTARWGSKLKYAQYHNLGTPRLPKRQFVGLNPALQNVIKKKVNEFINKALKK